MSAFAKVLAQDKKTEGEARSYIGFILKKKDSILHSSFFDVLCFLLLKSKVIAIRINLLFSV